MISVTKARAAIPGLTLITDDAVVEDMIARAVAFVQTYTRRYFGTPEQVTENLNGNGSYYLRLSEKALQIDSDDFGILVWERVTPWASRDAVAESEYEIRESDTVTALFRTSGAVWGHGYVYDVTYFRGYEIDNGPKDIEQVLLDLIALKVNWRGREGLKSETIGGYSYTLGGSFETEAAALPGAKSTLDSWRRIAYA